MDSSSPISGGGRKDLRMRAYGRGSEGRMDGWKDGRPRIGRIVGGVEG